MMCNWIIYCQLWEFIYMIMCTTYPLKEWATSSLSLSVIGQGIRHVKTMIF